MRNCFTVLQFYRNFHNEIVECDLKIGLIVFTHAIFRLVDSFGEYERNQIGQSYWKERHKELMSQRKLTPMRTPNANILFNVSEITSISVFIFSPNNICINFVGLN